MAAAGKVASFCRMLAPPQISSAILPCVKELANDGSQVITGTADTPLSARKTRFTCLLNLRSHVFQSTKELNLIADIELLLDHYFHYSTLRRAKRNCRYTTRSTCVPHLRVW